MSDFIRLHSFLDQHKEVVVRVSDIFSVSNNYYGGKLYSEITLYNDKCFQVSESVSEIFKMINGALEDGK